MAETYYVKPENSPVANVTLNDYDAMYITNGGIAEDTVINLNGSATVNDGGSANNTTVNASGTLHLLGGTATGVSVASDGRLEVNKGATATDIVAAEGAILAFDVAPDTHIAGVSGRSSFLIRNGAATGFVLETGVLTVFNGGTAVETTLNSAGFITLYSGGQASNATVNANGELKVLSGGTAAGATVNNGGKLTVSSGGTAAEATVKTGGKLTVDSSGFCDGAVVEAGGGLYVVSSGGTAAGTYIDAMGNLTVSSGGTAYGTTVGAQGFLTVGTKGIADGADVNGFLNVLDGGLASNVTVNENAVVYVQSKGTGSDVNVDDGGILEVLSGGRLKGATVAQGGSATIHADVMASNVVIDGGRVTVMSDGWASQDGVSSNAIVQNGGQLIISGGGYVVGAVVSSGGHVTVESDATFSSATVAAADVAALDGAIVSRLNLEAGGILNVASGGKAEHINVSAGGVLTGVLREASELKFYGGTLDLDISGVSPDSEALVDDTSFSSIMPVAEDYLCTLTVSGTQAEGAYKLIEGASGFDTSKAITVKNTLGATLGTLTVGGGATAIGGVYYTLALTTDDVLAVTVGGAAPADAIPPEVVVTVDETAMTNRNVTVTAEFTDNVGVDLKQYRIGDGAWTNYPDEGVTMEENGTVYFRAKDAAGNESEIVSHEVANIDKVAPTISGITPSTKEPADSVTVTANFMDDVALAFRLYSLGASGEWTEYPDEGVVVTANTTVYFKAVDAAGNESEVAGCKVDNIDTVPPEPDKDSPDDGWNDYLYSNGEINGNVARFVSNTVTGNQEIFLDEPGTVDSEGKHNLFGNDGTNKDTGDVAKISVAYAAKLTFKIESSAAGTFYIYRDGEKNGQPAQIVVRGIKVKKGKTATLKDVLLTSDADKYYVAMAAKSVSKVGSDYYGLYNVSVVKSTFFVDADEGEFSNNTRSAARTVSVNPGSKWIVLDGSPMKGSSTYKNFVGFTDSKDYARLDLASGAYLSFRVTASGASKFTIWKQKITADNTGKITRVSVTSIPKIKKRAVTAAKFFDTSKYIYYISMEAKDAAKGGSAYYNVEIGSKSVFFFGDDKRNNVLYNKTDKALYREDDDHHFENTTIGIGANNAKVKLDADPVVDSVWENFVGYGDAADYAKITLTSDGYLSFNLEATGNAQFTVYRMERNGNQEKLKAIQGKKLTLASGASVVSKTLNLQAELEAGEYYISMKAKSTKANSSGSVFYNVTATLEPLNDASALEAPMAAAAYADSVQDKLFEESGRGILASL
jgi:autotransporter passenger strand-loop-strand repeat protein